MPRADYSPIPVEDIPMPIWNSDTGKWHCPWLSCTAKPLTSREIYHNHAREQHLGDFSRLLCFGANQGLDDHQNIHIYDAARFVCGRCHISFYSRAHQAESQHVTKGTCPTLPNDKTKPLPGRYWSDEEFQFVYTDEQAKTRVRDTVLTVEQRAKLREIAKAAAAAKAATSSSSSSSQVPVPPTHSTADGPPRENGLHHPAAQSHHPTTSGRHSPHPHSRVSRGGLVIPPLHELLSKPPDEWKLPNRAEKFFDRSHSTQRSVSKAFAPLSRRQAGSYHSSRVLIG